MQTAIALGFGAFFVSSLAIGLRLVWLARRNRGLPELLIGLGILGIGPAGFALMVLAMLFGANRPAVAFVFLATAQLAIGAGGLAAYVFTRTVFRPDAALARAVVWIAALVFAAAFLGRFATGTYSLPMQLDLWTQIGSFDVIVCLLWGSFESLHYYGRMRRRARLGLADAVLTNRFLLWGLGIGSAGVGSLIANVVMMARGTAMMELDALTLSNSMFGLASAVLMWIAFLPPAGYRRWIEARARRAMAGVPA
ncbi:MAG TPA: hypothetical protein VMW19_08790 [Myxococcota bacterium]|nr:hypothetical protein [Myxococcota bacterium]